MAAAAAAAVATSTAATTAATAETTAAATAVTSPRTLAWEKRDGLVAIARRLRKRPLESLEMARSPEEVNELSLSASSWSEDKEELEDHCDGMGSYPNYMRQLRPRLQQPQQHQQRRGRAVVLTTDNINALVLPFLPLLKSSLARVVYNVFTVQDIWKPRKASPI